MAQDWAKSFYKSKLWADTRTYVLKRDCYRCQDCGAVAEEVHHIEWLTEKNIHYPKVSVNPQNLVSLCYSCHKNRHKKKIKSVVKGSEYQFDSEGNLIPPEGS